MNVFGLLLDKKHHWEQNAPILGLQIIPVYVFSSGYPGNYLRHIQKGTHFYGPAKF